MRFRSTNCWNVFFGNTDIEESVGDTLTKYVPRAMLDKLSSRIGHSSDFLKEKGAGAVLEGPSHEQ